jgi:hypothetical protein
MHHRRSPREHRFEYGIFLACIDLDELGVLDGSLRWFGWNRRRVVSFHDADHMGRGGVPAGGGGTGGARAALEGWLASQGIHLPAGARVRLLTFPRVLGYVFNPVSFYFVETPEGGPLLAVAEVGNTFGEQKPYVVPLDRSADGSRRPFFRVVTPKHFYVSPFSALDLNFDFRLEEPGERLAVGVNDVDAQGKTVLVSTLTGSRVPLTDAWLRRMLLRYPLVTLRTITLIHWQALRLWLKRLPWHRKSERPDLQRGVVGR